MKRQQTILFLLLLCTIFAGCRPILVPVYGLRPEYPDVLKSQNGGGIIFVEIDSLQPELRWESFPRQKDMENDPELASRINDITYDLKIWKAENSYPFELIYSREGLAHPYHTVQRSLEPSTEYIWTIRARFKLDGNKRVLDWGAVKGGLVTYKDRSLSDIFPNPRYYRFKTPPPE